MFSLNSEIYKKIPAVGLNVSSVLLRLICRVYTPTVLTRDASDVKGPLCSISKHDQEGISRIYYFFVIFFYDSYRLFIQDI